ncbi:MAG TPA: DUF309 domain-containing protein [Bryobacteraceae bacterium]|jgi:hypothetical protein
MDRLLAKGVDLFNRGEFFECHEVLEEAWTPERGPRRLFLQAVIHVAVACYHCQRGNPVGAQRQLTKALRKLKPYLPVCESIDTARLHGDAEALLQSLPAVGEYPRIHLAAVARV